MDRLSELRKGTVGLEYVAIDVDLESGSSAKKTPQSSEKMKFDDNQFLEDVELVKEWMVNIKRGTFQIVLLNQKMQQASSDQSEAEYSKQLKPLIDKINKMVLETKLFLSRFNEDIARLQTPASNTMSQKAYTQLRVRYNLTSTLTRRFVEVVREYQNAQADCTLNIKKKVKRMIQVIKADVTAEEIESVFKSGTGSGALIRTAIIKGEEADVIKSVLRSTADKYADVLTLEASVAELGQMFLDFAMLTDQQGELLERIQVQVEEAEEFVDRGNADILGAVKEAQSLRARQCCIAGTVLGVLAIVVAVVFVSVYAH